MQACLQLAPYQWAQLMIPIATILAHNHHPTFLVWVAKIFFFSNLRERGVVVKKIRFSAILEGEILGRYTFRTYGTDSHLLKQRRNMIL